MLETALTLPLMIALTLGFITILVFIEANLEVNAATALAAASAASAPSDPALSRHYAEVTYDGTINGYSYLRNEHLDRAGCRRQPNPNLSNPGDFVVLCTGRATLLLRGTPMAALGVGDLTLTATATAYAPRYRSRPAMP
ncbi:MAG: hypothetical protein ACYDGR_00680 [Candidatus Dormibacteria bacterium]